jgi:hypothetical protein
VLLFLPTAFRPAVDFVFLSGRPAIVRLTFFALVANSAVMCPSRDLSPSVSLSEIDLRLLIYITTKSATSGVVSYRFHAFLMFSQSILPNLHSCHKPSGFEQVAERLPIFLRLCLNET